MSLELGLFYWIGSLELDWRWVSIWAIVCITLLNPFIGLRGFLTGLSLNPTLTNSTHCRNLTTITRSRSASTNKWPTATQLAFRPTHGRLTHSLTSNHIGLNIWHFPLANPGTGRVVTNKVNPSHRGWRWRHIVEVWHMYKGMFIGLLDQLLHTEQL